ASRGGRSGGRCGVGASGSFTLSRRPTGCPAPTGRCARPSHGSISVNGPKRETLATGSASGGLSPLLPSGVGGCDREQGADAPRSPNHYTVGTRNGASSWSTAAGTFTPPARFHGQTLVPVPSVNSIRLPTAWSLA